ncbi:hypothetical protein BDQ17DRAFT_1429340 [Cyathus striatus]|nr:hypothetical protein BDQ17DRAFT_1429340 [Cyathus striatus]
MLNRTISIEIDQECERILVPFEALGYWSYENKAISVQLKWKQGLSWLKGHEHQSPAFAALAQDAISLLSQVSWTTSIPDISLHISMTELTDFLSDKWLSNGHIDAMLLRLKMCLRENSTLYNEHIIGCTYLTQSLTASWLLDTEQDYALYCTTANHYLQTYEEQLAENRDIPLWFVAFSLPGHWTAIKINPITQIVNCGDSLGGSMPLDLQNGMKVWLTHCTQSSEFKFDTSLLCAQQNDSHSCPIIAINTIKHHIFGDDLWTESTCELLHVYEFMDILSGIFGSLYMVKKNVQSMAVNIDLTEPALHLPLVIAPLKLHSAHSSAIKIASIFTTSTKRVHSNSVSITTEAKSKKQCNNKNDKNSSESSHPGKSSSALSKKALNEAVKNRTFVPNQQQWDNYVESCQKIDPRCEINATDPTRARSVRCSKCGEIKLQATVYDTTNFKKHFTVKCKGTLNTPTLNQGMNFFIPWQMTSNLPSKVWPCPGLTSREDTQITIYLSRTLVSSAGGEHVGSILQRLFSKEYSTLNHDQQQAVRNCQTQTHQWKLNHSQGSVYAIGSSTCKGDTDDSTGSILPFRACIGLLSLHKFLTAINKDAPEDSNHIYIPHIYQPGTIGKLYTKNIQLGDLFDNSTPKHDFLVHLVKTIASGKLDKKHVVLDILAAAMDVSQ